MKIEILVIGKAQKSEFEAPISDYIKRIKPYFDIQFIHFYSKEKMKSSIEETLKLEAQIILEYLAKQNSWNIVLDAQGKTFNSFSFASYFEKKIMEGNKKIIFIIGSSYGLSTELKQKASEAISLSTLTFPHQITRLILVEQLYRSLTIIHNQKYNH